MNYMKVMLMAQVGTVNTMWLPESMEGRYSFQNDILSDHRLPIYFEAEEGQWVAHVGRGAFFYSETVQNCQMAYLYDRMVAKILHNGEAYALYVEVVHKEDSIFLPYILDEHVKYTIGRCPGSHIYYPNGAVSWEHAVLDWYGNSWHITDSGSRNGTYVNGHRVESAQLHNGDAIYIMGLYILMGSGFVAINNANNRVEINSPRIRQIRSQDEINYPQCPVIVAESKLFDRQPHKQIRINPDPIHIDMPPMPLPANKIPMLLRMGTPMVMGGSALMSGNYLMLLTSLIFPALTQGISEKDRKEYEEKRTAVYREYLEKKEKDIYQEKLSEERLLNECYPGLSDTLQFSLTKKRLWERRKNDENFLDIRVGTGQVPMIAKREFNAKKFELERDILAEEMYTLAERPVMLENAPVMLSLTKDYIAGILGPIQRKSDQLRNIVMQLALTHSYDEVKIIMITDPDTSPLFEFVRYLPHNWSDDRTLRFFVTSQSDALQVGEYLSKEWESILSDTSKKGLSVRQQAYVILALDKDLFDCIEIFKEFLIHEGYCGISLIAAFDGIPKECSKIIDLYERAKLIDLVNAGEDLYFSLDLYNPKTAKNSMKALMRTRLKIESQAYSLPGMVTFLEMYGAGKVEHLNPLRRWGENNPVKSLSAPIGVGTDGKLFTLDLHEKRQGPHGLVAGMTGSGKSEFLITYILSMAVSYSPDEVAFILIDYKGGGLADAFEDANRRIHLPHLVGTITNLDGASIQRSLMSIKSELTRRQTVFKKIKSEANEGTLDIYDYQKLYRAKRVAEPMPHLFIISDEFAELKQQQPDFMDELISAARIGRSLGVHLILATQKPGGVVNDQIWSNTKFRACLRVQDRGDSMEMLKRPEAAELKHTGRFYLQVGYNEFFALGQSAWCGADYYPQDEVAAEQDFSVQFLDNVGQTILNIKPETEKKQAECRQIVAIVQYLSDLAKREKIEPKKLWTEPLPQTIELDTLINNTSKPQKDGISALIGLVDDPQYQRQFPLYLELLDFHNMLLVGTAGSGKSTFLRTILYSLLVRYSPEEFNYYILDLSNGMLSGYSRMPHCGAYLTEENETDLGRLLNFIKDMIQQRKNAFAQKEISSFEAYRRINPIPLILFIVDGFTKITDLKNGDDYFMKFQDYLREGANFGVRFILTCNHTNEVGSRSKQELDYRIALQAKDHYEYGDILEIQCKFSIPEVRGRGMCLVEERPLEYQTAMLDCGAEEKDRMALLRKRLDNLIQKYEGCIPAQRLPMVDFEQSYGDFCASFQEDRIPLGYSRSDLRPVAVPFQQLHSMSLYFGNPKGIQPVLNNLYTAAQRNHMKVIVVKRQMNSVFDDVTWQEGTGADDGVTHLECKSEGILHLAEIIMGEINSRNVLRDTYSIQNHIPLTSKGRSKKAAKYIRANSEPLFVIFESFFDFCHEVTDPELEGKFTVFFDRMRGYNIYFAAGFYPDEDTNISSHPLMKCYNKEGLLLLFGGRYDKISIPNIPYEITKFDKIDTQYNRFLLKYRENFHTLLMPCGKLEDEMKDPDEAAII